MQSLLLFHSHTYSWISSWHSISQKICTWFWFAFRRYWYIMALHWCHNERGGVSNNQPYDLLLNRSFGCRSKKTSKLRVIGLCEGNSQVTDEFPAQRASNAENISIWWRHHGGLPLSVKPRVLLKGPLLLTWINFDPRMHKKLLQL